MSDKQSFTWKSVNAYEACNGTLWRTADEAHAESKLAALAQPQHDAEAAELTVIDPDEWEPCSPAYLSAGGRCDAPRVWNAKTCNHWHPKLPAPPSPELERMRLPLSKAAIDAFQCGFKSQLQERHKHRFSGKPMMSAEEAGLRAMLKALRAGDNHASDGKESEGAICCYCDAEIGLSSSCQVCGMEQPSDPTPPDRIPGLNWELSEETKKHLAEIDRAIVRPGDPRLNQLVCGPQPNPVLGAESVSGAHVADRTAGANPATGANHASDGKESEGGTDGRAGRPWPSPKQDALVGEAMAPTMRPSPVAGIKPGPSDPTPPAREAIARFKDRIEKYVTQLNATGQADVAHLLRRDVDIFLLALRGGE